MRWPLAVSLVIVLVAGAFWYVKLRERADAATVQDHVALKYPGSKIGCSELKANGSLWGCAVVYPAESICLAVGVSYSGHISQGTVNASRCVDPALRHMLPDGADPDAVAADVTRIVGGDGLFTCAKVPNSSAHWACARPTGAGTQCIFVRVAPLRANEAGDRCSKLPALRAKVPFT
jgi:hypothetical protein